LIDAIWHYLRKIDAGDKFLSVFGKQTSIKEARTADEGKDNQKSIIIE